MTARGRERWRRVRCELAVVMSVASGCADESQVQRSAPSFVEFAAHCGDESSMPASELALWSGSTVPVTEECASAVGLAMGLDWESFGEEPHDFVEPERTTEMLVASFLLMVGGDQPSPAEILGSEGAPPSLVADSEARMPTWIREPGGGEFWFRHLADHVERTLPYGEVDEEDWGILASFSEGTLWVTDLYNPPVPQPQPTVLGISSLLVHESAHAYAGGHEDCGDGFGAAGGCDADRSGAYGVAVWWLHGWFWEQAANVDTNTCWTAESEISDGCSRILDDPEYPACAEDVWSYCRETYGDWETD